MSQNPKLLDDLAGVRARLARWYEHHKRSLPWREHPTPYRVWMSEIMLQQTRVDTVVRFFERFQADFPTVDALAAAREEEVLGRWAGLGYYRRARALHAAAKIVVERGGFPQTVEALMELPGVGRYTAGAIASIAFGVRAPLVDGNVARVLSRLLALELVADRSRGLAHLWSQADALVDPEDPSGHNQGLMELGALVCLPRQPRCHDCPLASDCAAHARGEAEAYPRKSPRRQPKVVRAVAGLLVHPDRGVLLARRPQGGLLEGLWEVPGADWVDERAAPAVLAAAWRERLGVTVEPGALLGEIGHVFTHRRLRLHLHAIDACRGEPRALGYPEIRWVARPELEELPLSRLTHKVLSAAGWTHE